MDPGFTPGITILLNVFIELLNLAREFRLHQDQVAADIDNPAGVLDIGWADILAGTAGNAFPYFIFRDRLTDER